MEGKKPQDVGDETKFRPQRSRPTFPGRPLPSNYDCAVSVEFLSSRSDIFTLKKDATKMFLSTSRKWVRLTTRLHVFCFFFPPRFELPLVSCPDLPPLFVLRTTATRQTGAPTCPAAHINTPGAAFGIVTRGDAAAILRRGGDSRRQRVCAALRRFFYINSSLKAFKTARRQNQ